MPKTKTIEPKVKKARKPRYRSRAVRAAECASTLHSTADKLQEMWDTYSEEETHTEEQDKTFVLEVNEVIEAMDFSETEMLTEEMVNWRDNMSGTSLENTEKFQRVSDAADTLEGIDMGSLGDTISDPDDTEGIISNLNDAADELENVEFPGMYG